MAPRDAVKSTAGRHNCGVNTLVLPDALVGEILSATEAAAIAAHDLVGLGDPIAVDSAAVRAMRKAFDRIDVRATVVIGEGEKDDAPMLYAGERLGTGTGPELDVAVDPVDGTKLAAGGKPDSVAVLSVAASGAFFDPGPVFYLEKLITTGAGRGLSLTRPLGENLRELADALGKPIGLLRVAVQDRPRNQHYLDAARQAGATVLPFRDGDVAPAIRAAQPDGDIDLLIGIGGSPEGVLTAAAVRGLDGWMEARLAPQRPDEIERAREAGISATRILRLDDLVAGDGYLFITAVTTGHTLSAVAREADSVTTDSWVIDPHRGALRITRRHPNPAGGETGR
ncbi:MAG: fructose,6-bisphosphatase [Microbacteriaceae bacterium]|nr:fructose,6-bisphosphatase [Microbacteriaceae bacterium]